MSSTRVKKYLESMRSLYGYEILFKRNDCDRVSDCGASKEKNSTDEYIFEHVLFLHDYERIHDIATWTDDISTLVIECERSSVIEIDRIDTIESTDQIRHIHHRYFLDGSHLHIIIRSTTDERLGRLQFHFGSDESEEIVSWDEIDSTREEYREVRDPALELENHTRVVVATETQVSIDIVLHEHR